MKRKVIDTQYSSLLGQLNKETVLHCKRVALMCEEIAKKVGLDKNIAYKIGLLHDCGKIYVPSRILKKNHGLTSLEREIIDLHSYFGYKLLKELGEPPIICASTLFHHGFWKIKLTSVDEPITDEMIKYIYLIHVIDMYEALTSKRAYHEPLPKDTVLNILREDVICTDELISAIKDTDLDAVAKLLDEEKIVVRK